MAPSERKTRAGCTIIARNYLAQAKVLAKSYLEHVSDSHFVVLVVDGVPAGVEFSAGITVLSPEDLDLPDFADLAFKYDVTELCTAVKPALMSFLFQHLDVQEVAYFDPDITIFRPLDEMWALLRESTILLIPHLLDPIPLDGKRPSEQDILSAGAYNLGFIALRASTESSRLLEWWAERLREHCRIDVPNGLFVDQKWLDLAPSLFSGTTILRDDTYDVAYWNLHSRRLDHAVNTILVNGRPLAFFHFSGFDPASSRILSKHQNRLVVSDGSPLAWLLDEYADALRRAEPALSRSGPYRYATFDDGLAISWPHRRLYGSLQPAQRREFGDPFKTAGSTSFFNWSCRSGQGDAGLSPFLERLLVEAADARQAFPDARGRQRKAFLTWAQTYGAQAFGYDPRLADPTAWNHPVSATPLPQERPQAPSLADVGGVNVLGYLTNETGIGAVARGFVGALRTMGVPVGLTDFAELSPNRSLDATLDGIDGSRPYAVNLVCVNADQHFVVKSHLGEEGFENHYNIGVWFWEVPSFPDEWLDRFAEYDEIWAPSRFIADTLAPLS
ncbi:MAG TPA: hypothetical protein VGQ62_01300, partial [Chloroflexota bacterium]|nr:hypothetical protein [Chloroflexota bacterium]